MLKLGASSEDFSPESRGFLSQGYEDKIIK
jgi:hypothetical protein